VGREEGARLSREKKVQDYVGWEEDARLNGKERSSRLSRNRRSCKIMWGGKKVQD
jgi:hypothetical protein